MREPRGQAAIKAAMDAPDDQGPTQAQVRTALRAAAAKWHIPEPLLLALAWHESRWTMFDSMYERHNRGGTSSDCTGILRVPVVGRTREDNYKLTLNWRYNIDEGARLIDECWRRAHPTISSKPPRRQKLESWFPAVALYVSLEGRKVRLQGLTPDAYANAVFDTLAHGSKGHFPKIVVHRPKN